VMIKTRRKTGIVQDRRYANHCTGPAHPECSGRQEVLDAMMQEPDMGGYFEDITPRKAEKEELLLVHSANHIRCLEETEGKDCTYLDEDTQTSPFSHETALLAAELLRARTARARSGIERDSGRNRRHRSFPRSHDDGARSGPPSCHRQGRAAGLPRFPFVVPRMTSNTVFRAPQTSDWMFAGLSSVAQVFAPIPGLNGTQLHGVPERA